MNKTTTSTGAVKRSGCCSVRHPPDFQMADYAEATKESYKLHKHY